MVMQAGIRMDDDRIFSSCTPACQPTHCSAEVDGSARVRLTKMPLIWATNFYDGTTDNLFAMKGPFGCFISQWNELAPSLIIHCYQYAPLIERKPRKPHSSIGSATGLELLATRFESWVAHISIFHRCCFPMFLGSAYNYGSITYDWQPNLEICLPSCFYFIILGPLTTGTVA